MSQTHLPVDPENFMRIIRQRRSVRKFEAGREVGRDVLASIANAGRWAPSGANVQPWDFIVIDDAERRDAVVEVFLRQANRLKEHARGFPAVYKSYLGNTVAIFIVLGDQRWRQSFPHGATAESEKEYDDNNDNIFYCSMGAAIQNIQLAVTAHGLTSAWLSGGGESQTNQELSELLGYPDHLVAYGTIPIGYPAKDIAYRYRRPLEQLVHWNSYQPAQYRTDELVDFYHEKIRPFAMYRGFENLSDWEDCDEKLGEYKAHFTGPVCNPK